MNSKKLVFTLVIGLVIGAVLQFFVMTPKNVFATESYDENIATTSAPGENTKTFTPTQDSLFEESEDPLDPGIPEVTTDDISNWVDRKGFEVISILQRFVQPFAIIIMIGCAFMTMIGVFGNQKLMAGGILGMFIAMSIYVVVLYAPEIMDWFLMWVRN